MYIEKCLSISSLLLCAAVTVHGHRPIDGNFINAFDASGTNGVSYRLPNNTKPEEYAIELRTNIDKKEFNFTGKVTIKLRALESTKNITLHQRQLTIGEHWLQAENGKPINVGQWNYDKTTEFLVIPVTDGLEKDQRYALTIAYTGELRADMGGFYRSSYVNSKNETRFAHALLASTMQFDSLFARLKVDQKNEFFQLCNHY